MFKHLRLRQHKGLQGCVLKNLGRINIICGKNNSGKSTLLEVINNHLSRTPGMIFSEDDVSDMSRIANKLAWLRYTPDYEEVRRLVEKVLRQHEIWFADQSDEFAHGSDKIFGDEGFQPHSSFGNLMMSFHNYFDEMNRLSSVLLPPKRQLELKRNIQTSAEVEPHGGGLLNYLLFAKNQNEFSPDYGVLQKIRAAFTKISTGYSFDVFLGKNNEVELSFSHKDGRWVKAEDCGLGLQDLLVILYFSIHEKYQVVLIEEPESHLHPDMQRRLLYFLREETDKQFFISTHSNVFLNNALLDRVFFTSFKDSVQIDDATSRASILDDLGYSVTDNLVSDLIILVEGPKDSPIIEEYLIKMGLFDAYDIKIWPLGGDIMSQVDLSVFAQQYRIAALIDRDPASDKSRRVFTKKCEELGIHVHRLKRYAIENYFSLRVLREVFQNQIPEGINEIDPKTRLEDQIGIDVKRNNRKLAKAMTLDEIEGTDFLKFLKEIRTICEPASEPHKGN